MPDSPPVPCPPSPGPSADGDGAAAPMEAGPPPGRPPSPPPPHQPEVEDDFQFLLCEGCRQESPNLKLLTCLHTLCLDCLEENKPIGQCPVCQTPIPQANGIPDMDNLLFISLQASLKVYRQIQGNEGPSCGRCKKDTAVVWCSECQDFLCSKCFEDHQWFLRKLNHEAKRLEDLRAESAHSFLESTRKSCNLFCSTPGHASKDYISSIYCRECRRALCCSCALLDSPHGPAAFCAIGSERRRRQEELGSLARRLGQGRSALEAAHAALRAEAARLEREQREMRELIRQRVEELVRLVRREEEELVRLVETRQERGRRELERELRRLEGGLRRLEAGGRLVEKMRLYGTEQEVMDMQPFVKASLEELQRLQPAAAAAPAQRGDLGECRARLQALVERVLGQAGTSAPQHDSPSEEDTTLILNLEPPREHGQQQGCHPTGLPAHCQPCDPVLHPSGGREHVCPGQGVDMSPTQPTPPTLVVQRDEEAEDNSGSAHGDTVPPPRSIQDSLASLQETLHGWASSNVQQADELLKMGRGLLQAQHRANRHTVSLTQEIRAMSHSLATIASAVGPLLQPMGSPWDPPAADRDWLSLPSTLLEFFPPSPLQRQEPPGLGATPCPSSPPPAAPLASPGHSQPPSPTSQGGLPKSRHPTGDKRGGKASTRHGKRRKK